MDREREVESPKVEIYRRVDLAVVAVLWMADIVEPWIGGWLDFTLEMVFGEGYDSKGKFQTFGFPLLFIKCATSVALSVIVDLKNHKAIVCLIGFGLASLTPILVIITVATRSEVSALLSLCVHGMFFVVTPLRYALIFNQKLNPSSMQVRKIAAALELTKSLSDFFFYLSKPDQKKFKPPALVVRWVIYIPMLICLLTLMDVVRKRIAIDDPKERTIKAATKGILDDMTKDSKSRKKEIPLGRKKPAAINQFALFVVLLLPIATAIIAEVIFDKMEDQFNDEADTGPADNSNVIDYKFFAYVADIVAIPTIAVVITNFKITIQTFSDYLLLAMGHVFNAAVLVYMSITVFQFNQIDPNHNGSWIRNVTRDVLRPGVSVIHIITCEPRIRGLPRATVVLDTSLGVNGTLIGTAGKHFPINFTVHEYLFSLRVRARKNHSSKEVVSRVIPNKHYLYLVVIDRGVIKHLVSFRPEDAHHPANPTVLISNGLTRELKKSSYSSTFVLYPNVNPSDKTHLQLPPPRTIMPVPLPDGGNWTFQYLPTEEYKEPLIHIIRLGPRRLRRHSLLILGDYGGGPSGRETDICITAVGLADRYKLSDLILNETVHQTFQPAEASVNALKGVTAAAISVGYLTFLWMESPHRFRTTILSFVMIGEEILEYTLDNAITRVTAAAVLTLTIAVFILGVIHIVVGRIYEERMRRELWYGTPDARMINDLNSKVSHSTQISEGSTLRQD